MASGNAFDFLNEINATVKEDSSKTSNLLRSLDDSKENSLNMPKDISAIDKFSSHKESLITEAKDSSHNWSKNINRTRVLCEETKLTANTLSFHKNITTKDKLSKSLLAKQNPTLRENKLKKNTNEYTLALKPMKVFQNEKKETIESNKQISNSRRTKRLKKLFNKYAEVSSETGIETLKSRQFIKLLSDSKVLDNKIITKSKAELVFASVSTKKGMNFDSFIISLLKLAEIKFHHTDSKIAFEIIISKYLLPLCDQSDHYHNKLFREVEYDARSGSILNNVYPTLERIYNHYFTNHFKQTRSADQLEQMTLKQILNFIRDFEIQKSFNISRAILIDILNEVRGKVLTLEKFFKFLFLVAVIGIDSIEDNAKKLVFLLSKMELSKGFSEFNKYYCIPSSTLITQYIPPSNISYSLSITDSEIEGGSLRRENVLGVIDEDSKECLKKLFRVYADDNRITCKKFLTLIKDYEMNKLIPLSELEALFNDTKLYELSYEEFVSLMQRIAMKVYPNNDLRQVLILFFNKSKEYDSLLVSPDIIKLKKEISKILFTCFNIYRNNTIMDYDLFIGFCRDFEIFPELCNKAILHEVFNYFCYRREVNRKEYLDKEKFLDVMVVCSFKSKFAELEFDPIAQVLSFLEKLVQSNGITHIKKISGKPRLFTDELDPMCEIKEKYEIYFKERSGEENRREVLEGVLGDI